MSTPRRRPFLYQFRSVTLQTGVAPIANGSALLNLGRSSDESIGGTEILAAAKLEVEDIGPASSGVEGGRIACFVSCSPAAYSYLPAAALDDLQHDYATVLHDALSHTSLRPPNLGIIPGRKAWLLTLDLMVLSDAGKCMTRSSWQHEPHFGTHTSLEPEPSNIAAITESGLDTRSKASATDFELEDSWDEGPVLGGRDTWPVCVTLNLFPGVHFLDATTQEEAAAPVRLLLIYSFPAKSPAALHGMHLLGAGDVDLTQIESLVKEGEKYALEIYTALNAKLKDEDCAGPTKHD
ncbi:hypothetical protein EI94DRAFT_1801540 [Lactarius quietus]|nr:hypothetical protein EI94DRAFT_1801540 [Lactarius quietus]